MILRIVVPLLIVVLGSCGKKESSKRKPTEFIDENFKNKAADGTEENIAVYEVDESLEIKLSGFIKEVANKKLSEQDLHKEIWSEFILIVPQDLLKKYVRNFRVITDGEGESLAFVSKQSEGSDTWEVAFDPADYFGPEDSEFVHTSIHEFAHLLFLNAEQMETSNDSCSSYSVSEGCLKSDSTLNNFYQSFWKDIAVESQVASDVKGTEDSPFYNNRKTEFVSAYASSDPVEDIAEVFTYYTLSESEEQFSETIKSKFSTLKQSSFVVEARDKILEKF